MPMPGANPLLPMLSTTPPAGGYIEHAALEAERDAASGVGCHSKKWIYVLLIIILSLDKDQAHLLIFIPSITISSSPTE
jgi:hypothetical protein